MMGGPDACASRPSVTMRFGVQMEFVLLVLAAELSGSLALVSRTSASRTAVGDTNIAGDLQGASSTTSHEFGASEEPGEHSRYTAPTIINKLRDVSEPGDASHERNNAAEELDNDVNSSSFPKPRDDNDADEHDDYEEKSDTDMEKTHADIEMKQIKPVKKRTKLALPVAGLAASEEDFYDWPETLPTPVALTNGATGKQRSDGTYVVIDSEEYPCVLAYFSSKITIYYPANDKDGNEEIKSVAMSPPSDATVSGTCDREQQVASLEISWRPGTFIISFDYDTLTDSWYVSSFQFAFNSGNAFYSDSKTEKEVVVRSEDERRFWTTSHARSFRCSLLHDIPLTADEGRFSGSVHFDEVRVQALTYGDRFKTPKHCMHRVQRDEKVPLIVGSTLAALTALTIGIYGAIRYYKIKKVQYDTMQ